jgi:hypothetical protein
MRSGIGDEHPSVSNFKQRPSLCLAPQAGRGKVEAQLHDLAAHAREFCRKLSAI